MAIASRANTEHIVNGFRKNEISSGFFTGRIHLLSTRTVTKYFAFSTQLVASPDANLKRWLFASVAGLNKLLLISERKSARHPVILAFAWPMRQLLGHLPKQLSVKASIHGLLPYDVPTREEISSYVHPGDDVYLLTDVVATGSLVNAVAASVIENSAQVRGVITLVDNREDLPANRAEIRLGRQQVPFVSVADFPRGKAEPLSKDQEYWVDPVTLVPQPQRPWGWDATLDPRIGDTIRLTVASKAVRCGHTIDGARHTSVYVDMRALLDADTGEVGKQVRSVFDRRMSTRGWSDFAPHVILYPAGIRRIETVASVEELDPAQLEELSIYATAVGLYCDRLRLIWGDTLLRGEVPRAFDPGGGARCSGQIFFQNGTPHNGQWRDVIIADDGMWRGTTMAALIRLAIAHGAQRIVAIPLLARMAPREVETIEAIVSVEGQPNDSAVEVCFVLPFLLPIPFYSANECPYESTQRRFRDREWFSETVRRLADSISHTLDGHHPIDAASQSPLYINAWLRLRSLVELASDNERALSELGDTIESLSNDDALLAMFTLFLEEWRLLGKARLRQTIAPRVKLRATQALREASPSNIKIAALSLLRSQFTDDFIEALDTIADQAVEDISLLERTLLHIATLTAAQRKSEECIRFLDRIQDNGPAMASRSHLAEKELTHYMNLIGACGAMTLEHRVARDVGDLSPRRAAIRAIEIIMDDDFLRHEIRAFINPLAKRGDSLIELSPRTFSLQAKDWKERYLVYLSDGLVAVLERFRPCLLQMSMQRDANASHIQYLTSSRPGAPRLTEDLVMLGFALDFLAMGAKHSLSISSLSQSAKRLATHLLNPECTLVQLIDSISHNTVAAFLTSYKDRVVERLTLAFGQDAIDVGIEGVAGIDQSRRLFVPKDMLDASATHILHNLESKAFFPASNETVGGKPKVLLSVATRRNAADDPCLVLTVKNNGNELVREVELGPRAKRAARNMQLFGGTLERPHAIEEHPWRVAQTMVVCLW
jgi:hypoxanthine-guanine phosphoribosyltransferase